MRCGGNHPERWASSKVVGEGEGARRHRHHITKAPIQLQLRVVLMGAATTSNTCSGDSPIGVSVIDAVSMIPWGSSRACGRGYD